MSPIDDLIFSTRRSLDDIEPDFDEDAECEDWTDDEVPEELMVGLDDIDVENEPDLWVQ